MNIFYAATVFHPKDVIKCCFIRRNRASFYFTSRPQSAASLFPPSLHLRLGAVLLHRFNFHQNEIGPLSADSCSSGARWPGGWPGLPTIPVEPEPLWRDVFLCGFGSVGVYGSTAKISPAWPKQQTGQSSPELPQKPSQVNPIGRGWPWLGS